VFVIGKYYFTFELINLIFEDPRGQEKLGRKCQESGVVHQSAKGRIDKT